MITNYLKTFFLSLKRQKGFVLINQLVLVGSMVVIMVLVAIVSLTLDENSQYSQKENIYSLKVNKGSYLDRYMDVEHMSKIRQCFEPEELCLISLFLSANIVFEYRNKKFNYCYVNKGYSELFKLEFIEGGNFSDKHFQSQEKVALISKRLAFMYFGSADVVGKEFILQQNRYKVVGVYKSLIKQMENNADAYLPWNLCDYAQQLTPKVFLNPPEGTTKKVLEDQIQKHAPDSDIIIRSMDEHQKDNQATALYPALILIGLSLALPALLLTNLTVHRMEIRLEELGVRKAFGASRKIIYLHLLTENIVFTLLAGLIAYLIGQYLVSSIYYGFTNTFWRFDVPTNVFLAVFGFFVLFGFVTGIIPARRVARQSIVQSLNTK